jgi:hypothetical protein
MTCGADALIHYGAHGDGVTKVAMTKVLNTERIVPGAGGTRE